MIVASVENLSFGECVRVQYRIRCQEEEGEEDARRFAAELQAGLHEPHNAISFLFYKPSAPDITRAASITLDWAPRGIWKEADTVKAGDYSTHKLAAVEYSVERERGE